MRDYPVHSIILLVSAVAMVAFLARQAYKLDLREHCVAFLVGGCFLCVASIACTVAAHYVPVKEQPIPSVRLSDPSTFHMSCGPECKLKGVGR